MKLQLGAVVIAHGSRMDLPMIEAMQTPALFACPENDSQMDAKFRGEVEEVLLQLVVTFFAAKFMAPALGVQPQVIIARVDMQASIQGAEHAGTRDADLRLNSNNRVHMSFEAAACHVAVRLWPASTEVPRRSL